MEFFRIHKTIPFMRYRKVFNIISIITFCLAVFFLITKGLNYSIEFTGGVVFETSHEKAADLDSIRDALEEIGYAEPSVQNYGSSQQVMIRLPFKDDLSQEQLQKVVGDALVTVDPSTHIDRVEYVGPQFGQELALNAFYALAMVCIGIILYMAMRFEWRFAISAIIANLHDIVIIVGFFAFFQWEFSLTVLAAILAVLGYSVNESVVVFDRIRETFRKKRNMDTEEIIDYAITSTMSRTIITHGSTEAMVLMMLFFGGPVLHYFAVALTIGICFGIYSSVLVASPLLMYFGVKREHFIVKKKAIDPNDENAGAVV